MGKQRKRLLVATDTPEREEFRLCSTDGCRNAVATWSIPEAYSGPVYCAACAPLKESK